MKIKVYLHHTQTGRNKYDETIIFASKEFGWLEFYEDFSPTCFKNKKELIETYKSVKEFKKYGNLTYIGEL